MTFGGGHPYVLPARPVYYACLCIGRGAEEVCVNPDFPLYADIYFGVCGDYGVFLKRLKNVFTGALRI